MDLAPYPFLTLEMAFKKNFIVVKMEDKAVNFHWLLIKAKPRLLYAILVGIVTYFLLHDHYLSTRFLIAWSAASATYLILVFVMMQYFNRKKISHLSARQDDGQLLIYIISLLASGVSLVAIFIHVGSVGEIPMKERVLGVLMTGITFAISWMVLHTAYALHYAHAYYACLKEPPELTPLIFLGTRNPAYSDFFHFSVVIGMTCQTADIIIVEPKIRNLVTTHSLLSFVFNATLLGLTMSLVGGLLS
jgi:uncharacterized membrane protein